MNYWMLVGALLLTSCATKKAAAKVDGACEPVKYVDVPRQRNTLYACMVPDNVDQLVCLDFWRVYKEIK